MKKQYVAGKTFKYVCFDCRKCFHGTRNRACPDCGSQMVDVGWQFKAPRRTSKKKWAALRRLVVVGGLRFGQHGAGYVPITNYEIDRWLKLKETKRKEYSTDKGKGHRHSHKANPLFSRY